MYLFPEIKPIISRRSKMKRFWGMGMVVCVSLVIGTMVPAQHIKPLKAEQKVMLIQGNKDWTNTGFTIGPRDLVTVTASGRVYFSDGAKESGVGPEGWDRNNYAQAFPEDANYCDDPLMTENHAALIADVNNVRFLLGPELTFHGKEGLFYLGINDCTFTDSYYNTGQFSVVIKVERNAVPEK
jgi:hypothetical protein